MTEHLVGSGDNRHSGPDSNGQLILDAGSAAESSGGYAEVAGAVFNLLDERSAEQTELLAQVFAGKRQLTPTELQDTLLGYGLTFLARKDLETEIAGREKPAPEHQPVISQFPVVEANDLANGLSTTQLMQQLITHLERLKENREIRERTEREKMLISPPQWLIAARSALGEFVDEDPERRGLLRELPFFDEDPRVQLDLHRKVVASATLVGSSPHANLSEIDSDDPLVFANAVATGRIVARGVPIAED
jgi:hypothetical protein